MKQVFFFIVLLAVSLTTFSQNENKSKSKIENFTEKSGTLFKKEFIDITTIGKLRPVKFQILEITDLINNTKISGLRLENEAVSTYSSDTKIAFIDKDEVEGLIKSLKRIKEDVITTTPVNYTEVNFKSRSGFTAGCFYSDKKKWSVYFQLERFDSKSMSFFSTEELDKLISALEEGFSKL